MDNRFLEQNLRLISRKSPQTAEAIAAAADPRYTLIPAKDGGWTLQVPRTADTQIYLHSKYAPVKEAERTVSQAVSADTDIVILGGFGLGYLAESAVKLTGPETPVIVIEKDAAILHAAFSCRDLTPLLSGGRFDFILTDEIHEITALLDFHATRKTALIIHRPSYDLHREFYGNLHTVLYSYINSKEVNIATLSRFEKLWTRNLLRNRKLYRDLPGVAQLRNAGQGVPAFIIGAGPSLQQQIPVLKKHRNKGIIIAVDTVFKVLTAHGIVPDITVAVDPQQINCQYFRGTATEHTLLVADIGCYPSLFHNYRGPVCLSAAPFPIVEWFASKYGRKGVLASGGSVSTSAFDLALQMGCDPLILLGQDLAYSRERLHVRGTAGEELWENSCTRIKPLSLRYSGFLHRNRTVKIPGWNGTPPVWSDRKFLTFLWWFEKKIKTAGEQHTVINATEGGASISGAREIPFEEAVRTLEPMKWQIPDLSRPTPDTDAETAFLDEGKQATAWLQEVKTAATKAAEICRELLYGQGFLPGDPYSRLDKTDRLIQQQPWATLLSSTLQKVIHTVNEGFSLAAADAEASPSNPLKESLELYTSIGQAAQQLEEWLIKYL